MVHCVGEGSQEIQRILVTTLPLLKRTFELRKRWVLGWKSWQLPQRKSSSDRNWFKIEAAAVSFSFLSPLFAPKLEQRFQSLSSIDKDNHEKGKARFQQLSLSLRSPKCRWTQLSIHTNLWCPVWLGINSLGGIILKRVKADEGSLIKVSTT